MFAKSAVLALFSIALTANANPTPQRSGNNLPCDPVHVIAVRGSSDPYPGPHGNIINAICAEWPQGQCGYEDVVYPATFENYCNSVSAGQRNGIQQITAYAQRCPDSKIVLSGYSQGGQVVGDILGGSESGNVAGCQMQASTGLDPNTAPGNRINAALTFGDVRHTANQPYNTGTGANRNGIAPRSGTTLQNMNRFSNVLRTWCNANDPVCAGGSDGNAHGSYFDAVAREAGQWVKQKLGTATQPPTSSNPGGNPTPTPTPTPTPQPTQPPSCQAQRWAQCGGNGYSGCTTCVSGTSCNKLNDWYSQCI